ncbi:MAG TPA: FAD-binding and (Fe-S)-binding domain-containing protein, partial [Vicinamibacterales bacterium]
MPDIRPTLEAFLASDQILDREIDRIAYASDASFYRLVPRAVVRPRTIQDVRGLLRFSRACRIPVTFRGAGTSLSGQAITDGVLVDLARHWRHIEPLDGGRRVRVQPGAIGAHVNRALVPYAHRIGPDPASIDACTMGGILSNNASGMCCGVAQNSYQTLDALVFVLPSGLVIDTSRADADRTLAGSEPAIAQGLAALRDRVRTTPALAERVRRKYLTKNTTGYSLNAFLDFERPVDILRHLLIGAEGTLAFIAEAVLHTVPDLPLRYTGLLLFASIADACRAIEPLATAGAAALEVMDRAALRSVQDAPGSPPSLARLPANAAGLLVEFQEPAGADVAAIATRAAAAIRDLSLIEPARFTSDPGDQALLWKIRKGMFPSVGAVRHRGTTVIIEDVAFPVAALASAVTDLQALFVKHGYDDAIIFGHAKDGNLHFVLTQAFNDRASIDQYARFMDDVVTLVVTRYDGALKAEHGTGRNMAPFVEAEWGREAYAVMREVKALVDPDGLLNPGVIVNPDPRAHLADLKSLPAVEEEVDRCIECGFCEPHCPSRDLTLTPRQRIVVRREMARTPASAARLAGAFEYDGLDTCAADGLCAVACPVQIDTGQLTKRLRAAGHSSTARAIASWTARHFDATARLARAGLGAARLVRGLAPRSLRPLPAAAPPLPRTSPGDAAAIYFPSCITRSMGALAGERNARATADAFIAVAGRAGVALAIPRDIHHLCCGTPYSSKGFTEAHATASNRTIEALWDASQHGALP